MTPIDPSEYDQWYQTPRGRWIGDLEYSLIRNTLKPRPEDSVLDVGCGTGHFTRSFAHHHDGNVVGIDPEPAFIEYARTQAITHESYLLGSGEELPIESSSFEYTVSITALCFVDDQIQFIQEMDRVSRKGMAVGLLNRNSRLWHQKGKGADKERMQELIGIVIKRLSNYLEQQDCLGRTLKPR